MSSSRHLIIGGLGNLGRVLQKHLLEKGVAVSVLDQPSAVSTKLPVDDSVQVHAHTLGTSSSSTSGGNNNLLNNLLENVDVVYSIVTPDVQHGTRNQFETTNIQGVQEIIDACQQVGVPKLIYGSSMAVTNHFISTRNGSEQDPLPPIETYQSYYDLTKRKGEELVLEAAAKSAADNTNSNLQACALRFGGIICGPTGYSFRRTFYENQGKKQVTVVDCQPLDYISAIDVCKAMWLAQDNMDKANGKAIFTTRSNDTTSPSPADVATYVAELLDWPIQHVPSWILAGARVGYQFHHTITSPFQSDPLGMPPHLFMSISQFEKTFSNQLAKDLMDFEAEIPWKKAVEGVVEEYLRNIES